MPYTTVKIPPEPPSSATTIAAKIIEQYGLSCDQIRSEHLQANLPSLNKVFPDTTEQPVDGAFKGLPTDPEPAPEPTWAVMIETRAHPALESVLSNVSRCCGIPIQLFHSKDNRDFVRKGEIARMVGQGRVTLTELNISGEIGLGFYNQLLLSPRFWELCRGRGKILVCQTDSICCSGSAYSLADFEDIDYIGSRWSRQRPVGLMIDGGSGGLSLRSWQASMDCLRRFPPARWPAGEDGYFGFHLDLMGARVGTMEEAGQFSTQDVFTHNSFGCHQISRLQDLDLSAFLAYCPEARSVFPRCEKTPDSPQPPEPNNRYGADPNCYQSNTIREIYVPFSYIRVHIFRGAPHRKQFGYQSSKPTGPGLTYRLGAREPRQWVVVSPPHRGGQRLSSLPHAGCSPQPLRPHLVVLEAAQAWRQPRGVSLYQLAAVHRLGL